MKVKYIWIRSLYEYLYEKYGQYIKENHICGAVYRDGNLYLGDVVVDLSEFKYKDKVIESSCGGENGLSFSHDEELLKYEDDVAELMYGGVQHTFDGKDCWSLDSCKAEITKDKKYGDFGDVEYSDFLPLRGNSSWKKSDNVPSKVSSLVRYLVEAMDYEGDLVTSKGIGNACSFQSSPLLRLYMSDRGLTVGYWDSSAGSDDYYVNLYYDDNKYTDFSKAVEGLVIEALKLGKPVRDMFFLLYGDLNKMYYRKNDDGEYTITIY